MIYYFLEVCYPFIKNGERGVMAELYFGFDLGGDTLKVAYAFKHQGKKHVGKLFADDEDLIAGLSAKALYDKASETWFFGDEIESCGIEDFTNTIRIKDLLALLKSVRKKSVHKSNVEYYHNKHFFPKFKFPHVINHQQDFNDLVVKQDVFEANETPEKVCENYFWYVRTKLDLFVEKVKDTFEVDSINIKIAMVYPASVGTEYREEVEKLIRRVFGMRSVFKSLNSTRAISYFALQCGLFSAGDHFLVFDMGEETLSVVKGNVGTFHNDIMLDGADGHSAPIDVGGVDVDSAVLNYLEGKIADRETMGYPSAGEDGHLYEQPLRSKQYLFMNSIKQAKMIFGMDSYEENFQDGLPISIVREVLIQRKFKKEDFQSCLGMNIKKKGSVADKILSYIENENKRVINREVKKIVLAGGVAETAGLLELVRGKIKKTSVLTFDNVPMNSFYPEHKIGRSEESVYAAAVGGALVALDNYEMVILFSRTYGTMYTFRGNRCFAAFEGARKGGKIEVPPGKKWCEFWAGSVFLARGDKITNDEILACSSTLDAVQVDGKKHAFIGRPDSEERDKLRRTKGLDQLVFADIYYMYNGKRISFEPDYKGNMQEGLLVDVDGNAIPALRNVDKVNGSLDKVKIAYVNAPNSPFFAYSRDIEYVFSKKDEDLTIKVTTR